MGMLFLSFWASLSPFTSSRPICLFHEPVIHHSCRLGLMVLPLVCQTFAALVAGLSAFHLDPQKWPLTFSPPEHMKCSCGSYVNKRPFCLSYFSSFFSFAGFLNSGPLYIYIYIFFFLFLPWTIFFFQTQTPSFPKQHTLSIPFSSPFSSSQTLAAICSNQALILWR